MLLLLVKAKRFVLKPELKADRSQMPSITSAICLSTFFRCSLSLRDVLTVGRVGQPENGKTRN